MSDPSDQYHERSSNMKSALRLAAALGVVFAASGALAQNPFNLTPQQQAQLQAKRKAWESWRANHKNISALGQTLMGIGTLESDPKTALTKDQAKKIVPVLKTWRNKPKMSDEDALKVNRAITSPLSDMQLKKIATAPRFGRGGPGFGGGARMGGGAGAGQGGGQRPAFDISKFPDPKDYNPLNPDTLPFEQMRPQAKQRIDKLIADLTKRAK
jgi:hypothetical protein